MFEEDRFSGSARPGQYDGDSNYHRWIYSRCAFMSSVIGRDMSGRVHTTSARRKGASYTSVNFRSTAIDAQCSLPSVSRDWTEPFTPKLFTASTVSQFFTEFDQICLVRRQYRKPREALG